MRDPSLRQAGTPGHGTRTSAFGHVEHQQKCVQQNGTPREYRTLMELLRDITMEYSLDTPEDPSDLDRPGRLIGVHIEMATSWATVLPHGQTHPKS